MQLVQKKVSFDIIGKLLYNVLWWYYIMLYTDVHTLYLSICFRFNSAETSLNALLERLFAFLLKLPFIGQWIHMRAHNLTRTGRVLNSFNIRKTRRTHFLKRFRGKKVPHCSIDYWYHQPCNLYTHNIYVILCFPLYSLTCRF